MKRYTSVILGCLLIGLSFNIFFVPYNLVPSGLIGLGALFSKIYYYNAAIFIAISNIILLLFSLPILGREKTYKYLLCSFLIPIIIYITKDISNIIYFENIDIIIVAIAGAVLTGYGYSLIYKEGLSIGGFEIIQEIFNKYNKNQNKLLSYSIEVITIILAFIILNLDYAVYSSIVILIIIYISTKSKLGINSDKTFFIITSKEDEVKDYLLNDLKYDYTEFNVRGGFTNQKNKVIMTVIDTKDYYELKEGIYLIDNKAFISIIDNYESFNKNIAINRKK